MFEKILVANRGEIACRVFKTAKRMGIKTVAVYSDADKESLHIRMADETVHIGAAPSAESYLVIENIINACKQTGAQAVHPGYGFLSENRIFAETLAQENIGFIGPNIYAIQAMGDKITSKQIAEQANVNTIPGFTDVIEDVKHAVRIANEIGYPVMLKASAGGGGKGMRVAYDESECRDGFERATNEAISSFGDGRIFIEKFIEQPRHIEIQVLADQQGNCIYLGERECSIQRRHQKVIEEAPSPFLDQATRQAMGEQAVALAKAVDYQSAGTVEFIVDAQKNFYFLEMNTRLQVEHPVTECITGLDLVEQMIRIADGEPLSLKQEDIHLSGWAMEARVYAEDPLRGFLPSTGRVIRYQPPEQSEQVRVDTGVFEGGEVSMFYDPMIAKLITYGSNRDEAIGIMQRALDDYYIKGVSHNISFLNALFAHQRFQAGDLSTNFIAEEYPQGFQADNLAGVDFTRFLVTAAIVDYQYCQRKQTLSGQLNPMEIELSTFDRILVIDKKQYPLKTSFTEDGYRVDHAQHTYQVSTMWRIGDPVFKSQIDDLPFSIQIERRGVGYRLVHAGNVVDAMVLSPRAAQLNELMLEKEPPDLSKYLLSPMPGLLIKLNVEIGQTIQAGEELAVVEAMKMENVLRASQDVVVNKLLAEPGDSLVVDQPILEFE